MLASGKAPDPSPALRQAHDHGFHNGNSAGVMSRQRYWTCNRLRRWLWRKHGGRGGLHKHYPNEQPETQYGLWMHGLMRGRKRNRQHQRKACPRDPFSPTLLAVSSRSFQTNRTKP